MVREKAFSILQEVFFKDAYATLLLKNDLGESRIEDIALITNIVYGTIQNYRYVRYLWERLITKRCKDRDIALLLDMAVYQIVFLERIADYAIVSESVNMAKDIDDNYAGFVNGVLRNVLRSKTDVNIEDELERLAVLYSHPSWLVKMISKQYGSDKIEAILKANNAIPKISARVNTLVTSKEELLSNYTCTAGELSEDALYFEKGNLARLDIYKLGEIAIQDESSQMVAIYTKVKDGDLVLDVCAAPGSKTMHMAARMHNTGRIISQEIYSHRCNLMLEAMERLHVSNVEVKCCDSLVEYDNYADEIFDIVLVDAPCSGFGVMARKPDIRLRANQAGIDDLIEIQSKLLHLYASKVKVNGYLVYSTCTLNLKENDKQIRNFLEKHEDFIIDEEKTIFPYEYNSDGFYICRLKKQKVC